MEVDGCIDCNSDGGTCNLDSSTYSLESAQSDTGETIGRPTSVLLPTDASLAGSSRTTALFSKTSGTPGTFLSVFLSPADCVATTYLNRLSSPSIPDMHSSSVSFICQWLHFLRSNVFARSTACCASGPPAYRRDMQHCVITGNRWKREGRRRTQEGGRNGQRGSPDGLDWVSTAHWALLYRLGHPPIVRLLRASVSQQP